MYDNFLVAVMSVDSFPPITAAIYVYLTVFNAYRPKNIVLSWPMVLVSVHLVEVFLFFA